MLNGIINPFHLYSPATGDSTFPIKDTGSLHIPYSGVSVFSLVHLGIAIKIDRVDPFSVPCCRAAKSYPAPPPEKITVRTRLWEKKEQRASSTMSTDP